MLRVGVVGDYDAGNETHRATDAALMHAAADMGTGAMGTWVGTDQVAAGGVGEVAGFDCILVAPGSPYRDAGGALLAIHHARTTDIPLLGTCGGFQHIVLELARNVLGYADAEHAEVHPGAPRLLITPLSCSLVGQAMPVALAPGSVAATAYGRERSTERYYCNFGLNPAYVAELEGAGLRVSGTGPDGEPRIVELPNLRFFMGSSLRPPNIELPRSTPPANGGPARGGRQEMRFFRGC